MTADMNASNGVLDQIAARQHGVVRRKQARACGFTDDQIRTQITARRWQRVAPRCLALFTGPLSREARLAAAVLCAGPTAVLSHATAAELHGMAARDDDIHLTVGAGTRLRPRAGVVIHRTRQLLDGTALQPVRWPPRTRVERTVVALVDSSPSWSMRARS